MSGNSKASEGTFLSTSGFKFSKEDRKAGKVRIRKLPLQVKKNQENGVKSSSSLNLSPVLPQFDAETMSNFPNGKQEPLETLVCKHCKKSILKRTASQHVAICLKSKQDKARKKKEAREAAQRAKERAERVDDDDDDDDDAKDSKSRKSAVNGDGDDSKKAKKRKADADDDKEPKKKKNKKEEQKPKTAKPKGPVDVEKQCGVTLPNGAQCARSLTCKSHSMGAKRAVPGRSLPYDMLLAAYQKKNQARQQKAAIDANAPALLEDELDAALGGPIDSDEEKDAVMTSIQRSLSRPQPLVTVPLFPIRQKYRQVRMKELLSNAMSGNRSGGLFSVPPESARIAPPSATSETVNGASVVPASPALASGGLPPPAVKAAARKTSIDVS
ncbi:hypothetical protein PV10_03104 [Exophiala mesophila]|uniref:SCA7 domain-containing protein n=2 Tax=Exophiala mesophila TaxID=212818 RepID=A0A0D2A8Z8_EXOME|nr:uncharacterized protein PV10_03104 [Exophiala mesophila]KIV95448.1 hypothetical protein PV10_03104 [Exophiala mesophila]